MEPSGVPHPNLSDKVNRNIVSSEIEGGVYLHRVASNTRLEVETQNRRYTLWVRENGEVLIWGHPVYCPAPTAVRISGSNWGGSMLKAGFIASARSKKSGIVARLRAPVFSLKKHRSFAALRMTAL